MEKVLSITVPSYNVEKYLDEIIPTFLAEEIIKDIEILIVNDGSKDRTAEIAEGYQKKYPGTVYLINKENGGHGSTINKGIEVARGRYFKVVDGDDWVDTKAFAELVKRLKRTDCDIVLTPFVRVHQDTGEREERRFTGIEYDRTYSFDEIVSALSQKYEMHAVTIKTQVLRRIPPIDEHCFYVDQEYILFPLPYLASAVFYDLPVYQYRLGISEQSMSVQNRQKNRGMHRRVIERLLAWYVQTDMSGSRRGFVEMHMARFCLRQILIYLSMDISRETRQELDSFTRMLKGEYPNIYDSIPGKKAWLLRISDNRLYRLLAMAVNHKI